MDKTQKPSAAAAAKLSSPRLSNKRRINYNEDDSEEDSEEEIVSSRRKTARSKAVLESSDDEEFDEESDEEEDEEEDHESAASEESEQVQKRPAKKSKTSNVAKASDEEMDDDADTVVASDDDSEQEVKKPAAKKKKTSTGWGSLVAYKGPVKPKKKPAAKKSTNVGGDEKTAVKMVKAAYTLGDDLPIISHPQGMFDDMISVQLTKNGSDVDILIPMLQKLCNRPLRMATMCSGTESPVLAIDMLSKAIDDFYHAHKDQFDGKLAIKKNESLLQIEHVFSCEIEPFKQAYIERNFQPPLLFRDIRELGNDQAYTAYGSLADVPCKPGDVDLLVAGTSCVDYSNLNSEKVRAFAKACLVL
jgi:site-specific DNA-cytosine methylase